jgi:spermidine synthase
MEYSFPHYLLSKQSVDDRALNKDVLAALTASLPEEPLTITEVGGGIGTMLARLLRWEVIAQAEYTLVDESDENIRFACAWLPEWAGENELSRQKKPGERITNFR